MNMEKFKHADAVIPLAIVVGLFTAAVLGPKVYAADKRNPYGDSHEEPRKLFKVHFDQTKFPELPRCAYAKSVLHYHGSNLEHRWGEVEIVLEDGRKITTTYSNIAVEE